jgi:glyoxylase-like metal-dependent hydrolase (beta-lactamase superfamily II)
MLEILPVRLSMVNCYLLKTDHSYALVDTGFSWRRRVLREALDASGCRPGDLKLILITHADFDHTGNCVWLHKTYGAPVAMHRAEAAAVERGRMFLSRKNRPHPLPRALFDFASLFFFRRFRPDLIVNEGDDLARYGLDARIIHIPGHSTGSIGLLTSDGGFFCGDLLTTKDGKPARGALVDDAAEMEASIERLNSLAVNTVYPGHGRPFTMREYIENNQ